jgi:hypothetical protein
MADTSVARQSTGFLAVAPQTTLNTAISLSASPVPWRVVPISGVVSSPLNLSRGTGRTAIAQANGRFGSTGSAKGSVGYAGTINAYVYSEDDTAVSTNLKLLAACGHRCDANGTDTVTVFPVTSPIVVYPASVTPYVTDFGPCALSAAWVNSDNATADSADYAANVTGAFSFSLTNGAPVTFTYALAGTNANASDVAVTIGTTLEALRVNDANVTNGNCLVSAGNFTITFTALSDSTAFETLAFDSFTFASNATTPDVASPSTAGGFATSPVIHGTPTVSFTLANSRTNEALINRWRAGEVFSLVIAWTSPLATYTFTAPRVGAISIPTAADSGGMRVVTWTGNCETPLAETINTSAGAPYRLAIVKVP